MKTPSLPHLQRRVSRGREYWYFVRRSRKQCVRLPAPSDPAFWGEYERALHGKAQPPRGKTFKALIASYRASERFTRLASRTRQDYDGVLEWVLQKAGDADPRDLERRHVIAMMTANTHRVRFANMIAQVLSVVMEHAIDIGMVEVNRAKNVRRLRVEREHDQNRPWPADVREAFEAKASPLARLVYELGIGTGQRIGDVLRMKWSDIRDDAIYVRQGKTGAEMMIPLTARLRAYLATVERRGEHIVAKNLKQPYAYETVRKHIRDAGGWTIHGLRYSCAADLAASGCTDEEIAAITGHQALAMVRKYSGSARQIARARSAQEKRE